MEKFAQVQPNWVLQILGRRILLDLHYRAVCEVATGSWVASYDQRMNEVSSLHSEWDLMYRQGLTVSKIATVCRHQVGTVSFHIRDRKGRDPSLESDHQANYKKPSQITVGWMMNIATLEDFHEDNGHYPTLTDGTPEARLGPWLAAQRRALKRGELSPEKIAALDRLPGWTVPQRTVTDQARWDLRLEQVKDFCTEHGRWPRYRSDDEDEKVLGVWIYVQRSEAFNKRMKPHTRKRLDAVLPGWNTWNGRRSARLRNSSGQGGET